MSKKNLKNCWSCIHRRPNEMGGGHHVACGHPKVEGDKLSILMSIFTGEAKAPFPINAKTHGIQNGWFLWPVSMDPIWLISCGGYEPKDVAKNEEE